MATTTVGGIGDADAIRERLINGLYSPVREIVLAVDEVKAAWATRDLDRMDRAVRVADRRVAEYLDVVQA